MKTAPKIGLHAVIALFATALFGSVDATTTIGVFVQPDPTQITGSISAKTGMYVEAITDQTNVSHLSVGAGLTLTCPGGGSDHGLRSTSITGPGKNTVYTVTIPSTAQNYTFIGIEGWQIGDSRTCTGDYAGRSAEGATGVTETGASFVFQVGSLPQSADMTGRTFTMTKPGQAGGGGTCNP